MDESQLFDLKKKVEKAKTTVSELTGQQTTLMKQLNDNWDCETIEEAEEKLAKMEKGINILERKIERGVKELERKYNIEEE